MRFSGNEIRDLALAGVMLSVAFAVLLSGGLNGIIKLNPSILILFLIAFLTTGTGFLLHELMHKLTAQSYGLNAEFRAFYPMLWLAIGLSFFGFIFAAPGAVFIHGTLTRERNGKISAAGPLTNIFLAVLFLIIFLLSGNPGSFIAMIAKYGLYINSLLAVFNMIPTMPLDGSKVISWSLPAYVLTVLTALGLFITSFII